MGMDARARAVPHGDERPIWATVHSGGSERIAHAVEHPRTSLPHNARLQPREGKKEGVKERKGLIMKMTTSVTSVAASAMVCALLLVFAQCASTQPSSGGGTPHKHTPHGWGSSGAYKPQQNSDNLTGRTGIPGRKMFSIGADIFAAGEEPKELLRVSGGAAADIHNLVDEEQANSGSKQ